MVDAINILMIFPHFVGSCLNQELSVSKTTKLGTAKKWFLIQLIRFLQFEGFPAFKVFVFVTHCRDFLGVSTQWNHHEQLRDKRFYESQNCRILPDWRVIDVEWEWRIFHQSRRNAERNFVWAYRIIINSCHPTPTAQSLKSISVTIVGIHAHSVLKRKFSLFL